MTGLARRFWERLLCTVKGHVYKEDWDLEGAFHVRFCNRCNKVIEFVAFQRDPEQERRAREDLWVDEPSTE